MIVILEIVLLLTSVPANQKRWRIWSIRSVDARKRTMKYTETSLLEPSLIGTRDCNYEKIFWIMFILIHMCLNLDETYTKHLFPFKKKRLSLKIFSKINVFINGTIHFYCQFQDIFDRKINWFGQKYHKFGNLIYLGGGMQMQYQVKFETFLGTWNYFNSVLEIFNL